jgi:hypothetical protein
MRPAAWLIASLTLVSGCGSEIGYPVPPQRPAVAHRIAEILDMTDSRPAQLWGSIVSGVTPAAPGADWRWVNPHPEFHFQLDPSLKWTLALRITAAKVALDKTGPQHGAFRVNGQLVGSRTFDHDGHYDLAFPLPPETLALANPAVVTMDFDPCMAQQNAPPLCVLLHTVGFLQEQP